MSRHTADERAPPGADRPRTGPVTLERRDSRESGTVSSTYLSSVTRAYATTQPVRDLERARGGKVWIHPQGSRGGFVDTVADTPIGLLTDLPSRPDLWSRGDMGGHGFVKGFCRDLWTTKGCPQMWW